MPFAIRFLHFFPLLAERRLLEHGLDLGYGIAAHDGDGHGDHVGIYLAQINGLLHLNAVCRRVAEEPGELDVAELYGLGLAREGDRHAYHSRHLLLEGLDVLLNGDVGR